MNRHWAVCFLQFLNCVGDRSWDFFWPVFLGTIGQKSLWPASVLEFCQTLGMVLLTPRVATWYASQTRRGFAFVRLMVAQRVVMATLGFSLTFGAPFLQHANASIVSLSIAMGGVLAAAGASITAVLRTVVSKDWTAVFCRNSTERARNNSMVTICELVAASLAPLLVSSAMSSLGSPPKVVVVIVMWQIVSAATNSALALHLNAALIHQAPRDVDGSKIQPEDCQLQEESSFTLTLWWRLPLDVRGAMCTMVLLYCTVLSERSTAWLAQHVTVSTIALWRSGMQIVGFIGAALAPVIIQRLGVRTGARVAQTWQTSCVIIAMVGFFRECTMVMLFAIAATRLGLWGFDLSERQLVQEAVTGAQRTPLFAMESSAMNVCQLVILLLWLLFPGSNQFGVLVAISAAATTAACTILHISFHLSQSRARNILLDHPTMNPTYIAMAELDDKGDFGHIIGGHIGDNML